MLSPIIKSVFIHFCANKLFEVGTIDESLFSQRSLTLKRRDVVQKYITMLEFLYKRNNFSERVETTRRKLEQATTEEHQSKIS